MEEINKFLCSLSPQEREELHKQRKHAFSRCTMEGVHLPHPDEMENLFCVVLSKERFVVDNCVNWKAESTAAHNHDKAFIVGRTVTDECENIKGELFGRRTKLANNNLFLLHVVDAGSGHVVEIERLDSYCRLTIDEVSLAEESRPRSRRTDTNYLERERERNQSLDAEKKVILLLLGVRKLSELPQPGELSLRRNQLLSFIRREARLCLSNFLKSIAVARHCYALLVAENQSIREEFLEPGYRNLFGDTMALQNALFLQARILSRDKGLAAMAGYAGLQCVHSA